MKIVQTLAGARKDERHQITFFDQGSRRCMSLAEFDARASWLALQLRNAGLQRGDRIGIVARNGVEWALLDLAAIKGGFIVAGFEYKKFEITEQLIDKYELKATYSEPQFIDGRSLNIVPIVSKAARSTLELEPTADGHVIDYEAAHVTTIKFTSGSTGEPKGIAATVGSIDSSMTAVQDIFKHTDHDNILIFLPLSLLQQRYWIYSALVFGHDVTVSSLECVIEAAKSIQPTIIMGVPSFFDGIKRQVQRNAGGNVTDCLVRRRFIEELLGKNIRYLWTGSAPASIEMLQFFTECGVPIYEGYGMNETCIVSKNYPGNNRIGSAGKVLPNKQCWIDSEGVLIVASDYPVNTSYCYCGPGDNDRMFVPNGGGVRTGDLARLDEDGYLYILGRVDDVIVLANGRNIHVRRIEERIRQHAGIAECILFGSGKPYLVGIISLADTSFSNNDIMGHINEINSALLAEERVMKVFIAPTPFAIENGLLTSQFKPKRKEIFRVFAEEVDQLYGGLR